MKNNSYEKKDKIFITLFTIAVILFFLYVCLNYRSFNSEINLFIKKYGYISVFITSFILDILEQPIGPEVPASIAIIAGLSFLYVLISAVCGMILASLTSYNIGKWLFHHRIKNLKNKKDHSRYYCLFERYGKLSLFIASISPVPYVVFCWLSGAFHMKIKDFILYGIISRTIRILLVLTIIFRIVHF